MALISIFEDEDQNGAYASERARYEAIFLERRFNNRRGHVEPRDGRKLADGHGAQGEPATGHAWTIETPVPEVPNALGTYDSAAGTGKRTTSIERRESLRDFAARLTGKRS
jgi:hypothetical protein